MVGRAWLTGWTEFKAHAAIRRPEAEYILEDYSVLYSTVTG